jgi:hypothetical protein
MDPSHESPAARAAQSYASVDEDTISMMCSFVSSRVHDSFMNVQSSKESHHLLSDEIYHCRCRKFTAQKVADDRNKESNWKHIHARESDHRLPKKIDVPDDFVPWSRSWPEYDKVVQKWSIDETAFQPIDNSAGYLGSYNRQTTPPEQGYDVQRKNPYGRTGLSGKGILPNLGPNEAAEPVITRSVMLNGGKQTQVLVCRQFQVQGHTFALPGGVLKKSELEEGAMMPGSKKIKEFLNYILNSNCDAVEKHLEKNYHDAANDPEKACKYKAALERWPQVRQTTSLKLSLVLQSGRKVYPNERYQIGYCDDPRNTDDAWVEAQVYHFHIPGAASGQHNLFEIRGENRLWRVENSRGEEVEMEFNWLNVDKGSMTYRKLYASHKFFVDLCLPQCDCGRTVFDRQDGSHRCLEYKAGPREMARSALRGSFVEDKDLAEYHKLLRDYEKKKMEDWVHTAARMCPYNQQSCSKFPVEDKAVPWNCKFDAYESTVVRGSKYDFDTTGSEEIECRRLLRNPKGRTGACGRGELKYWGANYARHAVVTRVDSCSGRTQVLLYKSALGISGDWYFQLPNRFLEDNDSVNVGPEDLVLEFIKAVLARSMSDECVSKIQDCVTGEIQTYEMLEKILVELFRQVNVVHPDKKLDHIGYCDDPRNTDEAWIETEVRHYHLPHDVGSALDLGGMQGVNPFKKDKACLHFEWVDITTIRAYNEQLFAAGVDFFVELCVPSCLCGQPKYDTTDGIHQSQVSSSAVDMLMHHPLGAASSALEAVSSSSELEFFRAEKVQGLMQFEGRSAVAKFVRAAVSGKRDAVALCRALFGGTRPQVGSPESWIYDEIDRFWRPRAVISVTGGAQAFDLEQDMCRRIFTEGIMKAAVAMKALIIDGGFNTGVMEKVGEAVSSDNRVASIGICPWGAVLGQQNLLYSDIENALLRNESKISTYKNSDDHCNSEWGARLDPNHPYFALIDAGLHGGKKAFGSEIDGRMWVEKELSSGMQASHFVPHILVIVNGGFGSIKTAYILGIQGNKYGHRDRSVPIVAVEGTKRAADMIAQCWRHLHVGETRACTGNCPRRCCVSFVKPRSLGRGETIHCQFLRNTYSQCFSKQMKAEDEEYLAMIVAVCRVKERITVYNCNVSSSLRLAIMKAAFTSYVTYRKSLDLEKERESKRQRKKVATDRTHTDSESKVSAVEKEDTPLDMLLEWDIVDPEAVGLAKSELLYFAGGNSANVLSNALVQNKHRFVEVLHDAGFVADPSKFQGSSSQLISYGGEKFESQVILKRFLDWRRKSWGTEAGGDLSKCSQSGSASNKITKSDLDPSEDDGRDRFEKFEELFLWSVVQGRREIAEIYFRKGHPSSRQQSLARALFACSIARNISQSPEFLGSARDRDKLEDLASHFEAIAADILNRCERLSPSGASSSLLIPFFEPWIRCDCGWVDGNGDFLTSIGMAYTARAISVVKLDAFQESVDKIWYGRLVSDLKKEDTTSDLFRGTLVQLPRAVWLGTVVNMSILSVFGNFAMDGLIISLIAFFPVLILLLRAENTDKRHLNLAHRFVALYTAPCTKFILSFCSYLTFVIIYTYVGFFVDRGYTFLEGVMHAWIFALYVAEARQCRCEGLRLWMRNGSNILDSLMLLAYLPAFILRMLEISGCNDYKELASPFHGKQTGLGYNITAYYEHPGGDLRAARSWHGIAGIFFWIRTFYFLRVSSTLGPLWIVLVRVTCKDVVYFIIFLIVFLVSFGAAIICAARPSHEQGMELSEYLSHMLYFPYMEIFGEHFLDLPYFSSYPGGSTEQDNRVLGTLLLCIYLFFSTIVLMNLLIAREYKLLSPVVEISHPNKPAHSSCILHSSTWFSEIYSFSLLCLVFFLLIR